MASKFEAIFGLKLEPFLDLKFEPIFGSQNRPARVASLPGLAVEAPLETSAFRYPASAERADRKPISGARSPKQLHFTFGKLKRPVLSELLSVDLP